MKISDEIDKNINNAIKKINYSPKSPNKGMVDAGKYKGIRLRKDTDRDGVPDIYDCRPYNRRYQDTIEGADEEEIMREDEMTEAEKRRLLEEMREQIEKEQKATEAPPPKTVEQRIEEREQKKPKTIAGIIKAKIDENLEERKRERQVYKTAYRKQKDIAIQEKAKRQAKQRFGFSTMEKVTGRVKAPPVRVIRQQRPVQKKRQMPTFSPAWGSNINDPDIMGPRNIKSPDVLGPWGSGKKQTIGINLDDALGSWGKHSAGSKKKKRNMGKIDPFEPIF